MVCASLIYDRLYGPSSFLLCFSSLLLIALTQDPAHNHHDPPVLVQISPVSTIQAHKTQKTVSQPSLLSRRRHTSCRSDTSSTV
jgi:hypothetical protein